jgi:hypothetical protein
VNRSIGVLVLFCLGSVLKAKAGPMPAPPLLPTPQPHIGFSGGDGATCATAVVITGAAHEPEGIRAQRWWAYSKNPGALIEGQVVSEKDGRDLETFTLILPDGSRKTLCFDITSFYGKF